MMYKGLRNLIYKRGACSLKKRMTGWHLTEDGKLLGIGLVPFRRKPCLYILDDETNEYIVLAIFSNEESASRARVILDRVARGVVRGELN